MNAKTKLSAKGKVVIPKDVRDHLGLKPGQQLDVIETAGGVLLRPTFRKSGRSTEEILSSLRELSSPYRGRPIPIEEIDAAAREAWGYRTRDEKK